MSTSNKKKVKGQVPLTSADVVVLFLVVSMNSVTQGIVIFLVSGCFVSQESRIGTNPLQQKRSER